MKTYIDREREKHPNLLLINAGDDFIGTVWDGKYGLEQAAYFINMLKPTAMVRGIDRRQLT